MATLDPRIDAYIAKAALFAQPVLHEIRARIHVSCKDVEEAIKWGMPAFLYRGKILCVMAAFKAHATLAFWKRDGAAPSEKAGEAMGEFGRLTAVKDLPGKREFTALLKDAMAGIEAGVPKKTAAPKAAIAMPPAFAQALAGHPQASQHFAAFAPSYQRDYLEWITEAKTEATAARRIAQAVEWLAEGKRRNWKYETQ